MLDDAAAVGTDDSEFESKPTEENKKVLSDSWSEVETSENGGDEFNEELLSIKP